MAPAHVLGLRCRDCGREFELAPVHYCDWCFGGLEVAYDLPWLRTHLDRERLAAGPSTIWRFADLLPAPAPDPHAVLPTGCTPLVRADRLAAELGLRELWLKDDTRNPTNSFKDRVVSVALEAAKSFGFTTLACASTGNLANAVAAHAARAGIESCVFIPADLEPQKILTTAAYGGRVVAIDGNYDDVNRLCAELADRLEAWAFVNVNVRAFYSEGSKTLAFETAEQLDWRPPDHVVVPMASGSLLTKLHKGFKELAAVGLIDGAPVRISGAQASGCSPITTAFASGADVVTPVKPSTIAKSLAIGNPADGPYALDTVRGTDGGCAAVSDDEVLDGIQLLARTEGIFAETAGGVTVAGLRQLVEAGVVRPDERVVAYITGHGLKTIDAVGPALRQPTVIQPTLDDFEAKVALGAPA
jgi:threonine synthase